MSRFRFPRLALASSPPMPLLAWEKAGAWLARTDDASDRKDQLSAGILIKPDFVWLRPGESLLLRVFVRDLFREVPEGLPFIWESSDPLVAGVNGEGRIWANGFGNAVITVAHWHLHAAAFVKVDAL